MTFPLFSDGPEPSSRVGYAGNILDRQSENRSDDCAGRALDDSRARLIVVRAGRIYMVAGRDGLEGVHDRATASELGADMAGAVLLGHEDGVPVLAVPSRTEAEALPETVKAVDFRSAYIQRLLSHADEGALAQGAALLAWHEANRFCGRCGAPSAMGGGGVKRVCPSCKTEQFPRTDPVAIMLAVDGDRCLLGRSAHFPPGMYSTLAGFVEPGETIENTVRREVFEESGIRVGRVAYHASQPWPYPHSLMIGCYAEAISFEIDRSIPELEDCRWFTRAEVAEMRTRPVGNPDLPACPPSRAIAARLIGDWVEAG
ncbi:MAG: NAD(+) diphosphatase [Notoacmeibacter sp.]|nr:NAD(+) diphosphatase [Notoacmeibacter sp.]MCC0032237.1 NAD(+) diphosphatase [Brucellaceae bacterium]